MSEASAPAVRELYAVIDRLVPDGPGEAGRQVRRRQLRMVAGMWERALDAEGMPDWAGRSANRLFHRWPLRVFWELAEAGELRAREEDRGRALPLATMRIVRDCMAILAREVVEERQVKLPVVPAPGLKDTVDPKALVALYRELVDRAGSGPLERDGMWLSYEDRTRLLALVSVVLDAGARSAELAGMRLTDLTSGEAAIAVRRRPQKAGPNRAEEIASLAEVDPSSVRAVLWGAVHQVSEATYQRIAAAVDELPPLPEVEWYPLREGSRVAVRRWLKVRENILDTLPIEGGRTALWVTLQASKAGPAGVSIRPQGLRIAYARGMSALNWVMAGEHGWSPMPTTLEQLRRSVAPVPLAGDEVPQVAQSG